MLSAKGQVIHRGTTPFSATLKRGRGFFQAADMTVEAQHDGQTVKKPIKQGLAGWYFGNLLFGGLPGFLIVDPLTGAMWALPSEVHIDFNDPANNRGLGMMMQESTVREDGTIVVSMDDVPEELRSQLVRLD